MYQGAQQKFQTRRLIPVCVCSVGGQWFIHPQRSMASIMLPNTTFLIGKILMVYVLLGLMVVSMLQCTLDPVQSLCKVVFSMIRAQHILGWHHENDLSCLTLHTRGKEGIYCSGEWNNLWDEMCSRGKNMRRLPGWKICRHIKAICGWWSYCAGSEDLIIHIKNW